MEEIMEVLIKAVENEGARNIEGYKMIEEIMGIDFEIDGKKYDLRLIEK